MSLSWLGFGSPVDVVFKLEDEETRRRVTLRKESTSGSSKDKDITVMPIYSDGETVRGTVTLKPKGGKSVEHTGISLKFFGQIELFFDRGNFYDIFPPPALQIAQAGVLREEVTVPFSFDTKMEHESYNGMQVRLRYLLRLTVSRSYSPNIVQDRPLWVRTVSIPPEVNSTIKMEVGIEDCLHIEFEYSKCKFHLQDVVVGKIYFLLVRIKIKHMELEIRRRESTGSGVNTYNETETLAKYEVMDGAPVRGECTPIRLFLSPYDLTPTYKDVDNKFSVKYFFNLVLVDEEDRRYFKQQEIILYREKL